MNDIPKNVVVNKERVRLLVDALRSGEFTQCKSMLSRIIRGVIEGEFSYSYCCLGVACELHRRQVGDQGWNKDGWNDSGRWYSSSRSDPGLGNTGGNGSFLTPEVVEWFGFDGNNPIVAGVPLSAHNDGGKTFPEIADMLEKQFLS